MRQGEIYEKPSEYGYQFGYDDALSDVLKYINRNRIEYPKDEYLFGYDDALADVLEFVISRM